MVFRRVVLTYCLAAAGWMSAACASRSLVVLSTYPNREVGGVTVSNDAGAVDIDTPNHFTTLTDSKAAPTAPAAMDEAKVHELFGKVLAGEPPAPIHFVLYFSSDSTDLLPASVTQLPAIVAAIRQRGSDVVTVVGHSDTSGDKDYNAKLSLHRAEAFKARLVAMGVAEASIEVLSHGEANPLIPTGDNVKEERNRRVEVVVR